MRVYRDYKELEKSMDNFMESAIKMSFSESGIQSLKNMTPENLKLMQQAIEMYEFAKDYQADVSLTLDNIDKKLDELDRKIEKLKD